MYIYTQHNHETRVYMRIHNYLYADLPKLVRDCNPSNNIRVVINCNPYYNITKFHYRNNLNMFTRTLKLYAAYNVFVKIYQYKRKYLLLSTLNKSEN